MKISAKYFIVNALLLIALVTGASAQSFDAGFLGGVAASQIDGDGYGGFNKAGAIAGIWVERDLRSSWSSRIELRYIQKGSYEKDKQLNITAYRLRLNYLELLPSVGYRFSSKFGGRVGLAVGYLASAKESDANGTVPASAMVSLRKFEISGLLGLQYHIAEQWSLEARLSYSAIPICPSRPDVEHWRNFGPFNRVLELCMLYEL